MRIFFECVAEAVVEHGVRGLAEMVPGGAYTYDIARSSWQKYCERCRDQKLHQDVVELAQANFEQARDEAVKVAREVLSQVPAGIAGTGDSDEDRVTLELYLTSIPEAVRQSLKRAEDPAGTTVPFGYAIENADDFAKLLPIRSPQLRAGDCVPGKPQWEVQRLLGIGGFGEVWFAQHRSISSLNGAIKFCLGQTGRNLIHEADLINRVMETGSHPNIVPLKDAHLEGDCPWLLYEYVSGDNLTDWIHALANKPLEHRLSQTIMAMKQLTDAVAFFHKLPRPIVHRDLKPSNILLDRQTKLLRVTDFGIGSVMAKEANRLETRGHYTRSGRLQSYLRGSHTPIYSSPEQRRGDKPDPRDDVHALGVIAYQMLTGRLDCGPGPRAAQTLKKIGVDDPTANRILNCASEVLTDRPMNASEIDWMSTEVIEHPKVPQIALNQSSVGTASLPLQFSSESGMIDGKILVAPFAGEEAASIQGFWAAKLGLSSHIVQNSLGMHLVLIPPGEFLMGSTETDSNAKANEKPQHLVRITKPFLIGKYQVTQREWKSVMNTTPWEGKEHASAGDRNAVNYVDFDDVIAFTARLSSIEGVNYSLPTEAQWEYACRAGSTTKWHFSDSNRNLPKYAWFHKNAYAAGEPFPHEVGLKLPNAFGLFDTHGNVEEWCIDCYDENWYLHSPSDDPQYRSNDEHVGVVRGGSFWMTQMCSRSAFRGVAARNSKAWLDRRYDYCGLRVISCPW